MEAFPSIVVTNQFKVRQNLTILSKLLIGTRTCVSILGRSGGLQEKKRGSTPPPLPLPQAIDAYHVLPTTSFWCNTYCGQLFLPPSRHSQAGPRQPWDRFCEKLYTSLATCHHVLLHASLTHYRSQRQKAGWRFTRYPLQNKAFLRKYLK